MQTQEEFAQFYLAAPLDAAEFPRSGNLHETSEENEHQENNDENGQNDDESSNVGSSGVDWRQKGYVTSVREGGGRGAH